MEKQIVAKILSNDSLRSIPNSHKQKIHSVLSKQFIIISATAKELNIDVNQLWRVYLSKCEYNKIDTREPRHIMFTSNEEKAQLAAQEKDKAQKSYLEIEDQTIITGYDLTTQNIRKIKSETEYALAIFQNEEKIQALSSMVPPYIKFKVQKCSNLYFADIPNQCIDKFPELLILLAPKKKTVIIGINGYSPSIDMQNVIMFIVGELRIGFVDANIAEDIDETHINKFWFFENYNPKRKYHFIYSNNQKSKNNS
jgi:hypothetical protein